ncbi:MAG: helix-turn-helix transcriptional regulator [Chloroflexi bacterium]|nr:helix-turn-helix transcriptional regulator [Chloroflexota bacterium]MYK62120.1 helix-turn-helix transcriptional regulator [Chloroflexota bacterium]
MKRRKPYCRSRLDPYKVWPILNRQNISQNELAKKSGISSGYLSQLISGTRRPSPQTRRRLMGALGVMRFEDLFLLEEVDD